LVYAPSVYELARGMHKPRVALAYVDIKICI